MKRGSWFGVLVAFGAVLGAGCGGTRSLDAFKDRALVADLGNTPDGRGMLILLLQERSVSNCASLSSEVQVTINGNSNVDLSPGGCSLSTADSPMITQPVDLDDTPRSATIVLSDATARMEVEVADLFAAYRLRSLKPGFDAHVELGQPGVNPVTRGEVLSFERVPAVRDAAVEGSLQQEHVDSQGQRSWTILDLPPAQDGAEVRVTIPAETSDGLAVLSLMTTEHPIISRCEGVASCQSEVMRFLQTDVTITP